MTKAMKGKPGKGGLTKGPPPSLIHGRLATPSGSPR
jgi:hypothetical protein